LVPQTGLYGFLGALLGTKLYHFIQFPERHAHSIWRLFLIWEGGYVFYGGLLGGVLGFGIHLLIRKTPVIRAADIAAPFLALGQAIVRVGCFLNGCCWGPETSLPWGVRFPEGSHVFYHMQTTGVIDKSADYTPPLHPTQLYMVGGLLAIFVLLKHALKHRRFPGEVCLFYCCYYGAVRFVVETYRGDSARSAFHMTVSQAVSLGLVVFALGAFAAVGIWTKRGERLTSVVDAAQDD